MRKLYIPRPSERMRSYGVYSAKHKRDHKANKVKIRFPWANKSFTYYPENPNKRDKDGNLENYWDQGCKATITGMNYMSPLRLKELQNELNKYNDYQKRILRLECEYEALLAGRYTMGAEVISNCDSLTFTPADPAPKRLRCVHQNDENLAKGLSKEWSWRQHYLAPGLFDAFEQRITELEADIQYEKDQAENLCEIRLEEGLNQDLLYQLYPEAQQIVEELAPQSSVAEEMEFDLGPLPDDEGGEDGDGGDGDGGMTDKQKQRWLILGGATIALALAAFIATKKIK